MEVFVKIINMAGILNIYANSDTNELVVNGNQTDKDGKIFIGKILSITNSWKSEYILRGQLDAEEFRIMVESGGSSRIIKGKGIYPVNYSEFSSLIREVKAYACSD